MGDSGEQTIGSGLTCLVADDHPAIVDSLAFFLESDCRVSVVGRAIDGAEALAKLVDLRPDVALIDVEMPRLGGIEITRRLLAEGVPTRVILYSGQGERAVVRDAMDAGACGYVLKGDPLSDLERAVRTVATGGTFVAAELVSLLSATGAEAEAQSLTRREREVLRMFADGLRNDEVAQQLSISPLTVRTHVKNVMEKLKAGTRTEAVAIALRQSLIL